VTILNGGGVNRFNEVSTHRLKGNNVGNNNIIIIIIIIAIRSGGADIKYRAYTMRVHRKLANRIILKLYTNINYIISHFKSSPCYTGQLTRTRSPSFFPLIPIMNLFVFWLLEFSSILCNDRAQFTIPMI